jgi:S1-C subfamily serine protease
VVARNERLDLALLQIKGGLEVLTPMPLANLAGRQAGERVVAMSNSGADLDIFAGILALPTAPVTLREALLEPGEVLLSDARFHDTLDGGPLVDNQGHLLGLYNASHVSALPEGFEETEDDEEKKPDTDYAVIVSANAIRAAFPEHFAQSAEPRGSSLGLYEAVTPIAAIAPSVVSVWSAVEAPHPAQTTPTDPPARLLPEHLASGVVISAQGLVLTSSKIFADEVTTASVRDASGVSHPASLLGRSIKHQVALLQVDLPAGEVLEPARLCNSDQATVGELVAVVGRPYDGLCPSVGVLSSLDRESFIQVASWVHPGHFGGAVVDRFGRLIAIARSQPASAGDVDEKSYLGFAAPLAVVLETFAETIATTSELELVVETDDEAALSSRGALASRVVERTRASLCNVLVSRAAPTADAGFDPFASDEKVFSLHSMGSGVVIDPSGLALTNWHVVDSAMNADGSQNEDFLVEATLPGGRRFVVDVLSTSRDDDLALISLRLSEGDAVVPVVLGDSDALAVGEPVFAIGNPHGLANSVSAGVISCKDQDVMIRGRLRKYFGLLQTDAAINPGNSGGALLDSEGRLVGINSAGRSGAGLAIPVARARAVFRDKLLSTEKLRTVYLGFEVSDESGALLVTRVHADSPASRAALEVGDEVLALDGEELGSAIRFAQALRSLVASGGVSLQCLRAGRQLDLTLKPQSYAAWRVYLQSGIEVSEVDYGEETVLVRDAGIMLHRAYSGDETALPKVLMAGALRVERTRSLEPGAEHPVHPGDLLLGLVSLHRGATADSQQLVRFEKAADLFASLTPLATRDGAWCSLMLLRDGKIVRTSVFVRRPPRK